MVSAFEAAARRQRSPAAQVQFQSFRSDWKYVYYLVATQDQADQILAVENAARNELAAAGLELPHRSVNAVVVDSPEQEYLVGTMLAEVDPEFVQFVDLRFAPRRASTRASRRLPTSRIIEQAPPSLTESLLFQPYPCSEGTIDEATAAQLALYGNCQ